MAKNKCEWIEKSFEIIFTYLIKLSRHWNENYGQCLVFVSRFLKAIQRLSTMKHIFILKNYILINNGANININYMRIYYNRYMICK